MSACLFTDIPSEWEKVIAWSIATVRDKINPRDTWIQ